MSMKNLGLDKCEVRMIEPENEIISLIEFNSNKAEINSIVLN